MGSPQKIVDWQIYGAELQRRIGRLNPWERTLQQEMLDGNQNGIQECQLVNKVNYSLSRISNWMEEHKLQIAPTKCEAVLSKKRGTLMMFSLVLGKTGYNSQKLRYLMLDNHGQHVATALRKTKEKLAKLAKLMPNIRRPSSSKREILCGIGGKLRKGPIDKRVNPKYTITGWHKLLPDMDPFGYKRKVLVKKTRIPACIGHPKPHVILLREMVPHKGDAEKKTRERANAARCVTPFFNPIDLVFRLSLQFVLCFCSGE
ncbi:hypothetical protein ILUMI_12686 [Ignelater luminosus]|uniref:Uncharacterized protein n=1 Tax=Ignelater luminosus TaxID=2038154 RepID=A0A8K0D2B3_IGNLU|nr:hypothetical protein ILUMI_12686 [Ignelater luminosus]